MAAYRTAARLFPGLHLPLLGMGCEYARMNNTVLAEQLLLSAHHMCPQVNAHASSELFLDLWTFWAIFGPHWSCWFIHNRAGAGLGLLFVS